MTQRFQEQFVKIGNYQTRYWQIGQQGTPVVLVHGLSGAIEYWQQTVERLALSHRVYAFDLLGFGLADKPKKNYTMQLFSDFLYGFVQQMGLEKFHLIGHSLGGGISLTFAGEHPDLIDKFILVCSAGLSHLMPLVFRLMTLPVIGELMAIPTRLGMERGLKSISYQKHTIADELVDCLYEYAALPGGKAALLSTIRSNMTWQGVSPVLIESGINKLKQANFPVLIIWGKQDNLLPLADAQTMFDRFPDAHVMTIDKCGHIPQLEQAQRFNEIVINFLDI